jgi:hypothetical protein
MAQNDNNDRNRDRDRGDRPDFRNMSQEERQNWFANRQKEQLEITDDAEWKAIQPLVQKVNEARLATVSSMRFGFSGRRGGPGGGDNGGDRRGGGGFGGQPSAEQQALEKAVDGKASNAELKGVLAKYQESRKAKQSELEKAQAELRKVLSVRQEALATLNGLL